MKYIKIICVSLAAILLSSSAAAQTIYEDITTAEITSGVTYSYIERLTDGSWQKINLITADLNNKNVNITPLFDSRGISYKNTLSNMAESGGAVAAVNADFFDTTTPSGRTSPIGLTVSEGEVITSASHEPWYATIAKTETGLVAGYFETHIYLNAENGNKTRILHINKYHSTQSIIMFTKDFGPATPQNTDNSVEMTVVGDKVTAISQSGNTPIPENGYILKVNPSINNFFAENFKVGDNATISIEITPNIGNIESAVGGGTLLLKNGSIPEFTHNVSGNHPRTAAGISKDGKVLYLVTVEGREADTPGMSQTALANLMLSFGAYNAINFDGGGSTEMVVRNDFGIIEVANTPSDGGERYISTGLGVTSVGENPYFASMKLTPSQEYVCVGDFVEIWATPFDNYHNPITIGSDIYFSADDGGRFEDNKYYPSTPGVRTVTATYGGVSAQININVLANIANLTFYPETFEGTSGYLSLIASDENGFKSQISPSAALWKIESGSGSVSGGNITANGRVEVSASFGGITASATINGYKKSYIYDKLKTTIDNPDFVIVPSQLKANTFLNKVINSKIDLAVSSSPLAFSTGDVTGAKKLDSATAQTIGNTRFITVRNDLSVSKGYDSWKTFLNLENATENNILIYLSGGREFSDESMSRMFDKTLKKLYNLGKNVFVVFGSNMPYADIHEGARFIAIRKNPEISLNDFSKTLDGAAYVKFKTSGQNLLYEVANLFE